MKEKNKQDELDIWLLLTGLVHIIQRYLLFISLSVLAGAAIGWLIFYTTPSYYKSRMIIQSGVLPGAEAVSILQSLQASISKGDYKSASGSMNLSVKKLREIQQLTIKRIENAADNKNTFFIEAEVYDPEVLDSLGKALVSYLKNNQYIQQRASTRKENLKLLKKRIDREIADLDTMKASVKELLQSRGSTASNFLADPASINAQIVALYEKNLEIARAIQLEESVELIQDFIKPDNPDGPQRNLFVGVGLVLGFLFSVLAITVLIIREKLSKELVVR